MRCLVLISLISVVRFTCAGEILVHEDFEKLDLKKLPEGYSTFTEDLSIAADSAQGKALKIAHKGGDNPAISFRLDLAKVAGHTVRVTAMARAPAPIKPVDGKPDALPELKLIVKDKDGADTVTRKNPLSDKAEWQRLSFLATIDRAASSVMLSAGLNLAAGEIWFDDINVEVDPDTRVELLAELAAKATVKKIDLGGVVFGPEVAEAMQKFHERTKSTPNVIGLAGPGLPVPEVESKPPGGWSVKSAKSLDDAPRGLLGRLPEFLAKEKPEIVFLFADAGSARKLNALESLDWQDLAKLCGRLGSVPVLVIPITAGNEDKDTLRTALLKAAENVHCPVIELGAGFTGLRVTEMAALLQRYVFAREGKEAGGGKTPGKMNDE